jgi:hypothetical protein
MYTEAQRLTVNRLLTLALKLDSTGSCHFIYIFFSKNATKKGSIEQQNILWVDFDHDVVLDDHNNVSFGHGSCTFEAPTELSTTS